MAERDEVLEQVEQRGLRPVDVLDDDGQRALGGARARTAAGTPTRSRRGCEVPVRAPDGGQHRGLQRLRRAGRRSRPAAGRRPSRRRTGSGRPRTVACAAQRAAPARAPAATCRSRRARRRSPAVQPSRRQRSKAARSASSSRSRPTNGRSRGGGLRCRAARLRAPGEQAAQRVADRGSRPRARRVPEPGGRLERRRRCAPRSPTNTSPASAPTASRAPRRGSPARPGRRAARRPRGSRAARTRPPRVAGGLDGAAVALDRAPRRRRRGRPCTSGSASRPAARATSTETSRRGARRGGLGGRRGPRATAPSAGSWARIACSSSRSRAPGSMPEPVDQRGAGVLVGAQRVGLAVAAVQGEHQLPAQPLAVRVLADQPLEVAEHAPRGARARASPRRRSSCAAARSSSSRAISRWANASKARSASGRPRHSASASPAPRPPPPRGRPPAPRGPGGEPLEAVRVELVAVDAQARSRRRS